MHFYCVHNCLYGCVVCVYVCVLITSKGLCQFQSLRVCVSDVFAFVYVLVDFVGGLIYCALCYGRQKFGECLQKDVPKQGC